MKFRVNYKIAAQNMSVLTIDPKIHNSACKITMETKDDKYFAWKYFIWNPGKPKVS